MPWAKRRRTANRQCNEMFHLQQSYALSPSRTIPKEKVITCPVDIHVASIYPQKRITNPNKSGAAMTTPAPRYATGRWFAFQRATVRLAADVALVDAQVRHTTSPRPSRDASSATTCTPHVAQWGALRSGTSTTAGDLFSTTGLAFQSNRGNVIEAAGPPPCSEPE
jgi:hypothetical protein